MWSRGRRWGEHNPEKKEDTAKRLLAELVQDYLLESVEEVLVVHRDRVERLAVVLQQPQLPHHLARAARDETR